MTLNEQNAYAVAGITSTDLLVKHVTHTVAVAAAVDDVEEDAGMTSQRQCSRHHRIQSQSSVPWRSDVK